MFGTSCILGCFGEGPYDNAKGESIWSGATMPTFKQCWEKTWARDSSQNYSFRQFKKKVKTLFCKLRKTQEPNATKQHNSMLNRRSLMWCCLRWWKVFWGKNFGRLSSASGWICYLADVLFYIIPKKKGLMQSYWGSMVWWMAMVESTTMSTLQCWMHLTLGFPRPDRGCSSSLWGEENRWLHSSFLPHGRKRLIFQWLWTRSSVVGGNADES